jgi:hypothetical protein
MRRDFWHADDDDKEEDDVPDLEVYIADLWPSKLKEEPISLDLDFVENRKLNIIFERAVPDIFDIIGAIVTIVGIVIIFYTPRKGEESLWSKQHR